MYKFIHIPIKGILYFPNLFNSYFHEKTIWIFSSSTCGWWLFGYPSEETVVSPVGNDLRMNISK